MDKNIPMADLTFNDPVSSSSTVTAAEQNAAPQWCDQCRQHAHKADQRYQKTFNMIKKKIIFTDNLIGMYAQAKEQLEDSQQRIKTLEQENKRKEIDNQLIKAQLKSVLADKNPTLLDQQTKEIELLKQVNGNLNDQIKSIEMTKKMLEDKIVELREEIGLIDTNWKKHNKAKDQLTKEVAKQKKLVQTLEKDNAVLNKKNEALQERIRNRRNRASGSFSQTTDSEHNVTVPSDDPQKAEDGAQHGEVFKSPLPEKKKKLRKKHRKSLTTDPSDDDDSNHKTVDKPVIRAHIRGMPSSGGDVSSDVPAETMTNEKRHDSQDENEKKDETPHLADVTSPPMKTVLVATVSMKARILEKKKQRALRSFLHHPTGTQLKEIQSIVSSLQNDTFLVEEEISKFCRRHCLIGHERQVVKKLISLHKKSADNKTVAALQQFLQGNSTGDSSSAAEQSSQERITTLVPSKAAENSSILNEASSMDVHIQVASNIMETDQIPKPDEQSDDTDLPVSKKTDVDPLEANGSDATEKRAEIEQRHTNSNSPLRGGISIFSSDDDDNEDITAQINSISIKKSDTASLCKRQSPVRRRSRSLSKSLSESGHDVDNKSPSSPVKPPSQSRTMRTRSISKSLSEASNPTEAQDLALPDTFVADAEDEKMQENIRCRKTEKMQENSSDLPHTQPSVFVSSKSPTDLSKSTDASSKDTKNTEVEESGANKNMSHISAITTAFIHPIEEDESMACDSVNAKTDEALQFSTAKKRKARSDGKVKASKKLKVISRKPPHAHETEKKKNVHTSSKNPEKEKKNAKPYASSDKDEKLEGIADECIETPQSSLQKHPILSSMKSLPFTVGSLSPNTFSPKSLDGNFKFLPKMDDVLSEDDVSVGGHSEEEAISRVPELLELSDILQDMAELIPTLPLSPLRSVEISAPSLKNDDSFCPRTEEAFSADECAASASQSKADEDSRSSVSPSADLCTAFSFSSSTTEPTTFQKMSNTKSKNFKKLTAQRSTLSSLAEDTRQGSAFNISDTPRRFSCEAPVQARPIPTMKPVTKAQSLDPALLGDFSNVSSPYNTSSSVSTESLASGRENPPVSLTVLTHKTSGPFKVVASNSLTTDDNVEPDRLNVVTTTHNFVDKEEKSCAVNSSEATSGKVHGGKGFLPTVEDCDWVSAAEEQVLPVLTDRNVGLSAEEDLPVPEECLMCPIDEDNFLSPLDEVVLLSPIKDPIREQNSPSEAKEFNLHQDEINEVEMHQQEEQNLSHGEKSDTKNLEVSSSPPSGEAVAIQTAKQARVSVRLTRLPSEALQNTATCSPTINCDNASCLTQTNDDSNNRGHSPERPSRKDVFQAGSNQTASKTSPSSQAAILESVQSFGVLDPVKKKFPVLPAVTIIQWLAAMASHASEETPECVLTPYLDVMDDVGDLGIKDLLPDSEYRFVMMVVAVDELRSERGKGITEAHVIPTALKILCKYGKSISTSPSICKDDGAIRKVISPILTYGRLNKAQTASLVRIFVSLCRSVGCARGLIDICRYVSLAKSFGDISHILYDCIACYPAAFSKHFPHSGKLVIYTMMFQAEKYFMDNKRPEFKENIRCYIHLLEKMVGWSDDENTSRLVEGKHPDSRWKKIFDTCVFNIEHAKLHREEYTKIVDGLSKMDVMNLVVEDMDDVFLSLEFLAHEKSLTFVTAEVIEKKFWLWLNEWSRSLITQPTDDEENKPVSDACMMATLRGLSSVLSVIVARQQTRHPGQPVVNQAVSYFETLCMVLRNLSTRYLKIAPCHVQCSVAITVLRLFVCKPQTAYMAVNAWLVATRDACSMSVAAGKKQKHPFLPQLVVLCPEKTLRNYVHRIENVTKPQRMLSDTTSIKTLLWGRS